MPDGLFGWAETWEDFIPDPSIEDLQAEISSLKYENEKLQEDFQRRSALLSKANELNAKLEADDTGWAFRPSDMFFDSESGGHAELLDTAPNGTTVLDNEGDVWVRSKGKWQWIMVDTGVFLSLTSQSMLEEYGPVTVNNVPPTVDA